MVVIVSTGGITEIDSALEPFLLLASRTLTVKFDVPAAVGVPLITPAAVIVSPAGSVPEARVTVYGPAPPDHATVALYGTATVAGGRDVVVMTGGPGRTVIVNVSVSVWPIASVAVTVNVAELAVVGVPVIVPAPDIAMPAGSEPPVTANVYGVLPPVAAICPVNGTPTSASGSVCAVTTTFVAAVTVIDSSLDAVRAEESVTLTVKVEVVLAATSGAVPVIAPVGLRVRPVGSVPEASAQDSGGVPAVAASV